MGTARHCPSQAPGPTRVTSNKKEGFEAINGDDIARLQLRKLPITKWRYKGSDEYHIGPMAQDFYALFSLGSDDVSISTIDPAGIALRGHPGTGCSTVPEGYAEIVALRGESG
jgi:hypothetical protein